MTAILMMGFLIGLRHALDADHLAAVASLASHGRSWRKVTRLGLAWGSGHAATLFLVGAVVLSLGTTVPEQLAQGLEAVVGALLVLLGLDVLRRALRQKVHIHLHRHGDRVHVHAHSHAAQGPADRTSHDHGHAAPGSLRALAVGSVQGLAGSAALVLLSVTAIESLWLGIGHLLVFGLGTLMGMLVLSFALAWPLQYVGRRWSGYGDLVMGGIGALTVCLGASILVGSLAGLTTAVAS